MRPAALCHRQGASPLVESMIGKLYKKHRPHLEVVEGFACRIVSCLVGDSFVAMVQAPDLGDRYNRTRPGRLNNPLIRLLCFCS